MINIFFLDTSPLASIVHSPDGRYLAIIEPGAIRLYKIDGTLLLRQNFPFTDEPVCAAFNNGADFDRMPATTELGLLYPGGEFIRYDLSSGEVKAIVALPRSCSLCYGSRWWVGTHDGRICWIEGELPKLHMIDPYQMNGAIVLIAPIPSSIEGAESADCYVYTDHGELFLATAQEELLLIEAPAFNIYDGSELHPLASGSIDEILSVEDSDDSSPKGRWLLTGIEHGINKASASNYALTSANGFVFLGGANYNCALKISSGEDHLGEIMSVAPWTANSFLVTTPKHCLKLTLPNFSDESSEHVEAEGFDPLLQAGKIELSVLFEAGAGRRISTAYPIADGSDSINVITASALG